MKTLLLVEDDGSLQKALQTKLGEMCDCQIIAARDGETGLQLAVSKKPDLILLDIIMPRLDGVNLLTKLREDEWGKRARVLVLTNVADDERVARCIELGAEEYLLKTDWKIEDLAKEIISKIG